MGSFFSKIDFKDLSWPQLFIGIVGPSFASVAVYIIFFSNSGKLRKIRVAYDDEEDIKKESLLEILDRPF